MLPAALLTLTALILAPQGGVGSVLDPAIHLSPSQSYELSVDPSARNGEIIVMGAAMPAVLPIAIAAATWLGLLGLVWGLWRHRSQSDQLIACALLGPPVGAFVLASAMPLVFQPNYLIAMAPGVVLGTARGWHAIASNRRWLRAGPWILIAMCLPAMSFTAGAICGMTTARP